MWLELKILLERCSQNATPLLDGEILLSDVQVTKDEIFDELFRSTNDLDLDILTQECLEMICCCCLVVIVRQLEDQLPGGKYYQPSQELLDETALCQRTNILSERDFAQMDCKVKQKQNISVVAACGVIMFLNNRTINWLTLKSEDDLEKSITVARKAALLEIKYYREKKKRILQARMDAFEKKKVEKEVKEQEKFDQRQELLGELEGFGGIWNSEKKVKDGLLNLKDQEKLKVLQLQIKARKIVLNQSVPDPKILQQGRSIDRKYTAYTVSELKANLLKAIDFSNKSAEDRASVVLQKLVLRPEDERKVQLEEAKSLLKEKVEKQIERGRDGGKEKVKKKKKQSDSSEKAGKKK